MCHDCYMEAMVSLLFGILYAAPFVQSQKLKLPKCLSEPKSKNFYLHSILCTKY